MSTPGDEYADFTAPLYTSERYRDVAPLREYMAQQERDEHAKRNEEIDFFIAMVESVDQLRYRAVELYKKEMRHLSQSVGGPLPLPWDHVTEMIFCSDKTSPPARLISYLAENHYRLIERQITNMRKVLNQKREMTAISRIQRLDSTCLRWFSRQPGMRAEEKAGSQQKLLSIVKTESYDTLENRVFRDFLKKCCTAARYYGFAYKQYRGSSRYKAVKKLMNLASSALKNDILTTVRDIQSVPIPNYVLQYDSVYRRIWTWYLQLLAKTRMVEMLWPQRHVFTADYFKLLTAAYLRQNPQIMGKPIFHSPLRIRPLPEKDGLLTDCAFYNNLYGIDKQLTEFRDMGKGEIALICDRDCKRIYCRYTETGISITGIQNTFQLDRSLPPDEAFSDILQQLFYKYVN